MDQAFLIKGGAHLQIDNDYCTSENKKWILSFSSPKLSKDLLFWDPRDPKHCNRD